MAGLMTNSVPMPSAVGSINASEDFLAPPPGLEDVLTIVYTVRISGLPNKVLSKLMMEAVLQQAGFAEHVIDFSTRLGKACGEATINLSSAASAERCAVHFTRSSWNGSDGVTAKVVDCRGNAACTTVKDDVCNGHQQSVHGEERRAHASAHSLLRKAPQGFKGLSALAPAWVPTPSAFQFAADAPAFVVLADRSSKTVTAAACQATSDDASTDTDGASEDGELPSPKRVWARGCAGDVTTAV